VVQKNNAHSLMHRHFATVCKIITRFSQKCAELTVITQWSILSILMKTVWFG